MTNLSGCLIVKNEEHWLASFFAHHKALVDEWVVVDTGSSDRSRQIAQDAGARVFDWAWTGDFAAARNESLKHATGKWIFCLDPDEKVASRDFAHFRELLSVDERIEGYRFETRNYTPDVQTSGFIPRSGDYEEEEDWPGYFVSRKVRLFRNKSGIQFRGHIHELIEESLCGEILHSTIPIHHYGNLPSEFERKGKGDLYLKAAQDKAEANAFDWVAWYQLGLEWTRRKDFSRAEKALSKSVKLKPTAMNLSQLSACYIFQNKNAEAIRILKDARESFPHDHDLVLNLSTALIQNQNYEEAAALLRSESAEHNQSFTLWRNLGFACMCLNQAHEARAYLERSQELCPQYLESLMDLALLDFHGRQVSSAKKRVEKILKVDPEHPRAKALAYQLSESNSNG